jgi:hypothetical protein
MDVAPHHIEDLFSAVRQRDSARFRAWLDIFSGPQEQYAAVRALAEALRGENSGPAYDLACWATEQLEQWLGFATNAPAHP